MNQAARPGPGHDEPHISGTAVRLNWLRAAVPGANDGVMSTAGLVAGVAGVTSSATAILTAGLAGLSAGRLAMASGEYVSVSSQRDAERALLRLEHCDFLWTIMREVTVGPGRTVADIDAVPDWLVAGMTVPADGG